MFRSGSSAGKRAVELRRGAFALTGHPTSDSSRAGLSARRGTIGRLSERFAVKPRTSSGARRRKRAASSFLERPECETTNGQVFWLPDRPTCRTFPPRWPRLQSRFAGQWLFAAFVPGYSGGTATDLHRFPYSSRRRRVVRDTHVGGHPNTGCPVVNDENGKTACRIFSIRHVLHSLHLRPGANDR